MRFLKRLLGSRGERALDQAAAGRARLGRQAPRVRTGSLQNIRFEANLATGPVAIPIQNLSMTGAGLSRPALARWPQRGERLAGALVYEDSRIPLEALIVRISPTVVGCTFERPSMEVRRLLERYFGAEIAALELHAVREDALNPVAGGKPVWLTGPGHTELYYVRAADGSIARFEITLFGNRFSGGSGAPSRYEEGTSGGEAPAPAPPEALREAYAKMIQALESIPASDKPALLTALRST